MSIEKEVCVELNGMGFCIRIMTNNYLQCANGYHSHTCQYHVLSILSFIHSIELIHTQMNNYIPNYKYTYSKLGKLYDDH